MLLTRYAVFVIEIKRRYKDIEANAPFKRIRSKSLRSDALKTENDSSGTEDIWDSEETSALHQNSNHALAVNNVIDLFPFERVYEQVVFVEPHFFQSDCSEFIDNVNVSCLTDEALFVTPIEKVCGELTPIASQEQIDQLGEQLVSTYGDINQKRAMIHIHRIRANKERESVSVV